MRHGSRDPLLQESQCAILPQQTQARFPISDRLTGHSLGPLLRAHRRLHDGLELPEV